MPEQYPWWGGPQPEPAPDTATVECPACGWITEVPPGLCLEVRDDYLLPGHAEEGVHGREVCWGGGWSLRAVRQMVRMRDADGGRLTRAAHP